MAPSSLDQPPSGVREPPRRVSIQLGWPQSHPAVLRAAELRPHSYLDRISGLDPLRRFIPQHMRRSYPAAGGRPGSSSRIRTISFFSVTERRSRRDRSVVRGRTLFFPDDESGRPPAVRLDTTRARFGFGPQPQFRLAITGTGRGTLNSHVPNCRSPVKRFGFAL
jgi:hypothetical protein